MEMSSKISFHPSLSGAEPVRWPRSAAVAAVAGFSAMDMVLSELVDSEPAAIRETLTRARLVPGPASLPVEFRLDEDTFRQGLAELPRTAVHAAAIGVQTMFRSIPASSHVPAGELLPTLRRRVSACAEILRENGIDFAIEVLGPLERRLEGPYEFIWRLPDGADFARSCDVGVLVDSWHWHHSGGTRRDISELGSAICHVHVADAAAVPAELVRDAQRLLPGEGIVDHQRFMAALEEAGYAGLISPEVRGYRCAGCGSECARKALEAVQRCLCPPGSSDRQPLCND